MSATNESLAQVRAEINAEPDAKIRLEIERSIGNVYGALRDTSPEYQTRILIAVAALLGRSEDLAKRFYPTQNTASGGNSK